MFLFAVPCRVRRNCAETSKRKNTEQERTKEEGVKKERKRNQKIEEGVKKRKQERKNSTLLWEKKATRKTKRLFEERQILAAEGEGGSVEGEENTTKGHLCLSF